MTTRRCPKCREDREPTEFYGSNPRCKPCIKKAKEVSKARAIQKLKGTPSEASSKALRVKTAKPRKSPLRAMSEAKEAWVRRYRIKVDAEPSIVPCWFLVGNQGQMGCNLANKFNLERHHPLGRADARILFYVWVTPELHHWIHDNAKKARELGLLLPEFSGRESKEGQPDPFGILEPYRKYLKDNNLAR